MDGKAVAVTWKRKTLETGLDDPKDAGFGYAMDEPGLNDLIKDKNGVKMLRIRHRLPYALVAAERMADFEKSATEAKQHSREIIRCIKLKKMDSQLLEVAGGVLPPWQQRPWAHGR